MLSGKSDVKRGYAQLLAKRYEQVAYGCKLESCE